MTGKKWHWSPNGNGAYVCVCADGKHDCQHLIDAVLALNTYEREVGGLRVRVADLESRFDGFREGVRIGMEYTRRELEQLKEAQR